MDVVVRPHRCRCGSWACKACASNLGKHLLERLAAVMERAEAQGLRGILISLTLDRSKWPDGPLSAWRRLRELRAVPRAVKAFCVANGVPYRGRYIIKMELQAAGWNHWHVLLLVPASLQLPKRGAFDRFWKWGFSNVRHEGSAYAYLCKYACKEAGPDGTGALEASGLPGRFVHWLQPSRGLWAAFGLGEFDESRECCGFEDEVRVVEMRPEETHAERVDRCRSCMVLDIELPGGKGKSYVLPWRRSTVAMALDERWGRSSRYFESGVLESTVLTGAEVLDVLEAFECKWARADWLELLESVGYRVGGSGEPGWQDAARQTTRSEATASHAGPR